MEVKTGVGSSGESGNMWIPLGFSIISTEEIEGDEVMKMPMLEGSPFNI